MYQKIVVVGRLGQDPEMKYTPSGKPVTTLSVATDRKWKDGQGEQKQETTWFRVVVWGNQAEVVNQYLSKGRPVLVEGRMQSRKWEDQQGQQRTSWELVADRVVFLPDKQRETETPEPVVGDDGIPY